MSASSLFGEMPKGERQGPCRQPPYKLVIGNAQAVSITVDGKPLTWHMPRVTCAVYSRPRLVSLRRIGDMPRIAGLWFFHTTVSMAKSIQAIPGHARRASAAESTLAVSGSRVAAVLASYGYREIRMPVLEMTELFKRSIGEVTDIVEKEIHLDDRNGDSLTLRPEGGGLRACGNGTRSAA